MPSSLVNGLLLSHHNLRIHNDDWSLVDHDEHEDIAPEHLLAHIQEIEEEDDTLQVLELTQQETGATATATSPLPPPLPTPTIITPPSTTNKPSLSTTAGVSSVVVGVPQLRSRLRTKHGMSMISGGGTKSTLSAISGVAAPPRRGTYTSSTLIYITSCFGASCLGMPWAFMESGWGMSLILLGFTMGVTQWGAGLLLGAAVKVSGEASGGVSIKQVAMVATPKMTSLPEVLVIINCLGSAMGSLIVAADLVPLTFQDLASLQKKFAYIMANNMGWKQASNDRLIWVTVIQACVVPLCFLRDITPLKYAGLVSVFAVSFMTCVIAAAYFSPDYFDTCEVYGPSPGGCATNVVAFSSNITGILAAIPAFFFNYSSNYQLLTVHNSLKQKSTRTSTAAVGTTMVFVTCAYVVLGLTSYFTFGDTVKSNILGNYGNNVWFDLARLFIIFSVALLFPLTIFTARASVMSILGQKFVKKYKPKRVFMTTTLFLVAFSYVVAISIKSLNVVLGVGGALSTVPITLVLPGLYTIALAKKGPEGDGERLQGRVAMWTGIVLTFLCLYGALAIGNS